MTTSITKGKPWDLLTDLQKADKIEYEMYEYMDCAEKDKWLIIVNKLKGGVNNGTTKKSL